MIHLDNNRIVLHKDIIEIYSKKSFFGKNEQEATEKSLDYWDKFLIRLENELKIILVKPRVQNISIVKQHYAETNSKLAKEVQKKGNIKVYCKDDGKLAVTMDDSFNLMERECVHPRRSKHHSEAITKQISDFIENDPPTNSELALHLSSFLHGFDNYGKHIASHIDAIKLLGREIKRLNKTIGGVVKENKKLKLGTQKELGEFI